MSSKPRPIALVDLDGTLCDFSASILEGLAELREPGDRLLDETALNPPLHIIARRKKIMSAPGFWRNLRPIPAGIRLIDLLTTLRFDTFVLTKGPSDNGLAWTEKFEWCRKHVPEVRVIIAEDKAIVHGDVLVEDWPPYAIRWRNYCPNGLVIVPKQQWNVGENNDLVNAVRYDGENIAEIQNRLMLVIKTLEVSRG